MERIYDLAEVFRSKNAGPLLVTFDMLFADEETYRRVLNSGVLNAEKVAELYDVDPTDVEIFHFDPAHAIKVTIPRKGPTSGAPGDRDVYGAQQHRPLADLVLP